MYFTELRYQDPRTKSYLGSPSLARLPNGDLIATHDYFGPGYPRNHEGEEHLLSVYLSHDDGAAWQNITAEHYPRRQRLLEQRLCPSEQALPAGRLTTVWLDCDPAQQ